MKKVLLTGSGEYINSEPCYISFQIDKGIPGSGNIKLSNGSYCNIKDERPSYKFILYMNDGTTNIYKTYTAKFGDTFGCSDVPTRNGYTFLGWSYNKDDTDGSTSITPKSFTSDSAAYAIWQKN